MTVLIFTHLLAFNYTSPQVSKSLALWCYSMIVLLCSNTGKSTLLYCRYFQVRGSNKYAYNEKMFVSVISSYSSIIDKYWESRVVLGVRNLATTCFTWSCQ